MPRGRRRPHRPAVDAVGVDAPTDVQAGAHRVLPPARTALQVEGCARSAQGDRRQQRDRLR